MSSRTAAIFDPLDPCSPLSVPNYQTALLLLDYHNISVAMLGSTAPQILRVARAIQEWAAESGMSIFHCLVDTASGVFPEPQLKLYGRYQVMAEKLISVPALRDEHEGLAFVKPTGVNGSFEETVYRRPGLISALLSGKLLPTLRERGIRSLILAGISTSGCVLSTCRDATDKGFIATVVEDACADTVPGLHDSLMSHVLSSTAHIAKGKELKEVWKLKDEVA